MAYSDPSPEGVEVGGDYVGSVDLTMPTVTSQAQLKFQLIFPMAKFAEEDPTEGFQDFIDYLAAYSGTVPGTIRAYRSWSVSQEITPTEEPA